MSGIFSSPKTPTITSENSTAEMPTVDSEEVRKAKLKQIVAQSQRTGRSSTLISENDKLGGAS